MSRTLTLEDAAALLNTTQETVSAMIRRKHRPLPAARVGRAYVLVDDDVIEWLRGEYIAANDDGESCESTDAHPPDLGGAISGTQASALDAALARPTSKRRANTSTATKPDSGEPTDSATVRPLHGIPRS